MAIDDKVLEDLAHKRMLAIMPTIWHDFDKLNAPLSIDDRANYFLALIAEMVGCFWGNQLDVTKIPDLMQKGTLLEDVLREFCASVPPRAECIVANIAKKKFELERLTSGAKRQ